MAHGLVCFGTSDGYLWAVDAVSGERRWRRKASVWVRWAPLVANGTLYVGTNDGHMVAPDAVSGEEQWTAEDRQPGLLHPGGGRRRTALRPPERAPAGRRA
ncbi:PQQ-binding-like beta-propeller repeat protein [Streptomyces canus]|uniref:outer membrane protein assembly factor BamB family protein n=1 Tax=Streptomyces canus TaxID=58343 RepID=UPI003D9A8631